MNKQPITDNFHNKLNNNLSNHNNESEDKIKN